MLSLCGLLLLTISAAPHPASAQTATVTAPSNASHAMPDKTHATRHVAHPRKRHHAQAKPKEEIAPSAPPPPVPPAQQAARPATIDFTRGTLRIEADNSSLVQILTQISHQTGMVVDGLNTDKRIYGQYGPGSVTATLTQLLDGAGYNYVIVGGEPGKPPTKLLLTNAGSAPASPAPAAAVSVPVVTPASPPAPTQPRTPQQIFNELRHMHHHPQ